jgi:hypothetical protein
MASRLGPIDVCCDAPPYPAVRACQGLGFHAPLDVRWCRMSHPRGEHGGGWGILNLRAWMGWFGLSEPERRSCTCGQPLPALQRYAVTCPPDAEAEYLLGQCPRCRTMFWEAVLPSPWAQEGDL